MNEELVVYESRISASESKLKREEQELFALEKTVARTDALLRNLAETRFNTVVDVQQVRYNDAYSSTAEKILLPSDT
jgi:hypothetical protein